MSSYDNEYVLNDNTPVGNNIVQPTIERQEKKEGPGFFRSIYEEFKEYNPIVTVPTAFYKQVERLQFVGNEAPEGWDRFNIEKLQGINNKSDWMDILNAGSPEEQDFIRQQKLDDQSYREWLDDGNLPGRLIGGIAGYTLSPIKIPTPKMFMSLSKSTGFIANAINNAPGIMAESVILNSLNKATHETKSWREVAEQSLIDGVFGSVIFGGMGLKQSLNLQKRLGNLKYTFDDIEYVAKFNEKGSLEGWKAEGLNDSVSAARVSEAQKFLDEGLYLYGEKSWFKNLFTLSPVTKMMTSSSLAMREWGGAIFRPSGVLKYKSSFAEGAQSAEQIMKGYLGEAYNMERIGNNLWEEYIGINPNLPNKDTLGHLKKQFASGKEWKTRTEFMEEAGKAFRNGDVHEIPQVQQFAQTVRGSVYDKIYKKAVELELLPPDLDPITAISYLNKNYNKGAIQADGPGFRNSITNDLMLQSEEIKGYNSSIDNLKQQLKNPDISREEKTIIKDQLKLEQKLLDERILNKEIPQILVSDRIHFTKAEQEQLEQLREPAIKLREEINSAIKEYNQLGTLKNLKSFQDVEVQHAFNEQVENTIKQINLEGNEATIKKLTEDKNNSAAIYKDKKERVINIKKKLDEFPEEIRDTKEFKKLQKEYERVSRELKLYKNDVFAKNQVLSLLRKSKKNITPQEMETALKRHQQLMKKVTGQSYKGAAERKAQHKKVIAKKREHLREYENGLEQKLQDLIDAGKLSEKLYYRNKQGFIKLRDPLKVPGLRKALSRFEAENIAMNSFLKIQNINAEQMFAQAFEERFAGTGTNPLHRRTLMVRDNAVQDYLVNDLSKLTHIYTNFMAKMIGLEESLKPFGSGYKDGLEYFTNKLNQEFTSNLAILEAKPKSVESDKAIKNLYKEKDKNIKLLNQSLKAYWGNYNLDKYSPSQLSFLSGLRDWTVSTALGALPFVQVGELGNIMGEYGVMKTLGEGLFPTIANLFKPGKNLIREDLAHVKLAIDRSLANYGDSLWGHGTDYHPRGFISRTMGQAANKLGQITGSNLINDILNETAGRLSMSKTLSALDKYNKGGVLTKLEHERLHLLGMNKKEMAGRIMAQFEEYGSPVKFKNGQAYEANFHLWKDNDATSAMLNSIQQEVEFLVLKPNIADVPFAFRDPVLASMTLFMSYSFASTQARLINLMQRPTLNKLIGTMVTMTMGAYVNPLREYVSGREPDLSAKGLMASAITNGLPGGYFIDGFNRMNAVLNIPLLRELKNDRFAGKGASQLLGGAMGSALDDMIRLINIGGDLASGRGLSDSDARKMIKSIPWAQSWQFRAPIDSYVKSLNLPKTKPPYQPFFSE